MGSVAVSWIFGWGEVGNIYFWFRFLYVYVFSVWNTNQNVKNFGLFRGCERLQTFSLQSPWRKFNQFKLFREGQKELYQDSLWEITFWVIINSLRLCLSLCLSFYTNLYAELRIVIFEAWRFVIRHINFCRIKIRQFSPAKRSAELRIGSIYSEKMKFLKISHSNQHSNQQIKMQDVLAQRILVMVSNKIVTFQYE